MANTQSNETLTVIHRRRSHRAYKPEQIKESELTTIIEAAKVAPSSRNQQPWHFTVIQQPETLAKINGLARGKALVSDNEAIRARAESPEFSAFYKAPTLVLVSADSSAVSPKVDASLAAANLFIAAESLNIGTVWVNAVGNLLNEPESESIRNELKIPAGYSVVAPVALGYKLKEPAERPARREGTVTFIR